MKSRQVENEILKKAIHGDIIAYQKLFSEFQASLKSYLYRLLADRNDSEDLTHDTFVRGFDKINTISGEASFKTWIFTISTRLAYDELRKRKRWSRDAQDQSKAFAEGNDAVQSLFRSANQSPYGAYEITEHIDFCFTCISKTLSIENQVALILKDVYDFPVKDIALILEMTVATVKNQLYEARSAMIEIFDNRCALVSKKGHCHQCSELNAVFNPKQNQREALMKVKLAQE
ncbi:MAG: RNA polymerase sigma factor, partial [Cyclobacteriaceae bacterium]